MSVGRQHPRSSRRKGAKVVATKSYANGMLLRDARIVTASMTTRGGHDRSTKSMKMDTIAAASRSVYEDICSALAKKPTTYRVAAKRIPKLV